MGNAPESGLTVEKAIVGNGDQLALSSLKTTDGGPVSLRGEGYIILLKTL